MNKGIYIGVKSIENGYLVTQMTDSREKQYFCSNNEEVCTHVSTLIVAREEAMMAGGGVK